MPTTTSSKDNYLTTSIVRLCIDGWVYCCDGQGSNFSDARTLLNKALSKSWPYSDRKVEFTVLPGGFIFSTFPDQLADSMESGWNSRTEDFQTLTKLGEECVHGVLTDDLIAGLSERTRHLTLGIDFNHMADVKTSNRAIKKSHVELVAVVKLTKRKAQVVAWTGKSYPTDAQEDSLVQVVDLDTHCVRIDGLRILVLGCHDLNMFSMRAWASQKEGSVRRQRCARMRRIAKKFDPTIVIHHPHQTDSSGIWQTAWSGVRKVLPSFKQGVSGIAYYPAYDYTAEREELPIVLKRTKFGTRIEDVVIEGFR